MSDINIIEEKNLSLNDVYDTLKEYDKVVLVVKGFNGVIMHLHDGDIIIDSFEIKGKKMLIAKKGI